MKDVIYSFLKNYQEHLKNYLENRRDIYNSEFGMSHKTLCFSHVTSFQGCTSQYGLTFLRYQPAKLVNLTVEILPDPAVDILMFGVKVAAS